MEITAATIESALEKLPELPTPVSSWRIEVGPDATDDPAVWVWASATQSAANSSTINSAARPRGAARATPLHRLPVCRIQCKRFIITNLFLLPDSYDSAKCITPRFSWQGV